MPYGRHNYYPMEIIAIKGSRARKILLSIVILLVYCIFLLVFYHFMRGNVFPYGSFSSGLKIYLANLIPTSILTLLNIFIIFRLVENSPLTKYLPLKITADFVVSILSMYLFIWIFESVNRLWRPEIKVDAAGVLLHNVLIIMTLEIVYYVRRSREAVKKAEYAKREALQYQYDALKAQVNPHFLFNSLNILLSLMSIDMNKATDFTIALSHIYRYVLSIQNKTSVLLSEELKFLNSYVSILEIRYNQSFRIDIENEGDTGDKHIVPFTMQLLVENVTKHNVISSKSPMHVSVRVCGDCVTVSNHIKEIKESSGHSSGIGLKYIAEQYRINGKEFRFENDGKTFTAIVPYL